VFGDEGEHGDLWWVIFFRIKKVEIKVQGVNANQPYIHRFFLSLEYFYL
jgi:hypothetical protein